MITKKINEVILELVSIDEAKDHSRITDYDDDDIVQAYLDSSHNLIEQWLNRKLQPTQMVGFLEIFKSRIVLPYPPVTSIESITAEDESGTVITIPVEDYKFNDIIGFVKISSAYSKHIDFTISFTCGYPVDNCPVAVKHAIKMTFATLYEMREDAVIGTQINSVPITARNIIKSFRVRSTG